MKKTLLMIGVAIGFIIGSFFGGLGAGYLVAYKSATIVTTIEHGNDWVPMLQATSLFLSLKFAVLGGALLGGILGSAPCLLGLSKLEEE